MFQSVLKLKPALEKVLPHFDSALNLEEQDYKALESLCATLEPVKVAVEKLCRRDATLLTAETIFCWLLAKLQCKNDPVAQAMYEAVRDRYKERRQHCLVSLYKYLNSPSCMTEEEQEDFLGMPSKATLVKLAKKLLERLFATGEEEVEEEEMEGDEEEELADQMSLAEELETALHKSSNEKPSCSETGQFKTLSKEMTIFESSGKRTENLELLFQALEPIPPTSVEAERAFSVAGRFLTKERSRMSDKCLDNLCFLQAFFKQ